MKLERLLREIAGGRGARKGGYGTGYGTTGHSGHGHPTAGHGGSGARHGGGIGETIGRMIDQQLSGRRHGKGHAPRGGGDLGGLLRRFGGRRY